MSYKHLSITERELLMIYLVHSNRLKLDDYPIQPSYKTIYRAFYAAMFDTPEQRRSKGNRGKILIRHALTERSVAANNKYRVKQENTIAREFGR